MHEQPRRTATRFQIPKLISPSHPSRNPNPAPDIKSNPIPNSHHQATKDSTSSATPMHPNPTQPNPPLPPSSSLHPIVSPRPTCARTRTHVGTYLAPLRNRSLCPQNEGALAQASCAQHDVGRRFGIGAASQGATRRRWVGAARVVEAGRGLVGLVWRGKVLLCGCDCCGWRGGPERGGEVYIVADGR
jgi:hypothetical protein